MLKLIDICRTYRPKKGVPVKALDKVNLDIEETGLVFILGKSGSGKSTLLNVLGGLDRIDSGEIIIKDKSSKDFSQSDFDSLRNTMVGFIFQEYNILNEFTVGQNIALALNLQGKKATSAKISQILEEVDLVGYGNRKPNELSGGQKQRVAIARALIKNPEIIMADEPTGALDSNTGKQVFETLKKLSKDKLILVVSHDREFAEQYGDRVIELADGKIISDIKKYKATANDISSGVKVIDNKIIFIKKGYTLTQGDNKLINEYLAKNDADTFISLDSRANEVFKQNNRIDSDGNKESFTPTTAKSLAIKKYDGDLKMIKSRLPFKDTVKIGASGMRSKPIRLFFTILLSAIAFCMFGLADAIGSFDKISNATESLVNNKINYLSFTKLKEIKNEDWSYFESGRFNDDDTSTIVAKFPNNNLKKVFAHRKDMYSFRSSIYDPTAIATSYYSQEFSGYCEMTQPELEAMGYTVTGAMPTNDKQIAITDYTLQTFKVGGLFKLSNDGKQKTKITIDTPTDIIGKKIVFESHSGSIPLEREVTAVVDTKFDYARYAQLAAAGNNNNINSLIIYQEFYTTMPKSPHCVGFVASGYSQRFLDTYGTSGKDQSYMIKKFGYTIGSESLYVSTYKKLKQANSKIIYLDEANKGKQLATNEIIISVASLSSYCKPTIDWYTFMQGKYEKYAQDNFELAKQQLAELASNKDYTVTFYDYVRLLDGIYYEAPMPQGLKNGKQLCEENIDEYMAAIRPTLSVPEINRDNYDASDKVKQTVVGVAASSANAMDASSTMYVDDSFYNELPIDDGDYAFVFGKMPTNSKDMRDLVEYSYSVNNGIQYQMSNSIIVSLNMALSIIQPVAEVFLYLGIGLACFGALLLLNFIATSIAYKKREIGILRAVGARGSDILGIFFTESMIVALINFVVAAVGGFIVAYLLNGMLLARAGIQIMLIHFGLRQLLLMLGVSTLTAFLASAIPVSRIARMKPIDAITKN